MRITVYRVVTVTVTVTVTKRVRMTEMVECDRFEMCVYEDRMVISVVFVILSDVND
jgi:hypothetical protein